MSPAHQEKRGAVQPGRKALRVRPDHRAFPDRRVCLDQPAQRDRKGYPAQRVLPVRRAAMVLLENPERRARPVPPARRARPALLDHRGRPVLPDLRA
jgi:hypothetical protein